MYILYTLLHILYIYIYIYIWALVGQTLRPWSIAMFPRHPASRHREDTPTRATSPGSTTPEATKKWGTSPRSEASPWKDGTNQDRNRLVNSRKLKITSWKEKIISQTEVFSAIFHSTNGLFTVTSHGHNAAVNSSALAEAEMCFSRLPCLLMTSS